MAKQSTKKAPAEKAAVSYATFTCEDVPVLACIKANAAILLAQKKGFQPYLENSVIAGGSSGNVRITIPWKKKAGDTIWKLNTSTNTYEYALGFLFDNLGLKTQVYVDGVLTFFGSTH